MNDVFVHLWDIAVIRADYGPLTLCTPNGHYIEYFGFDTDAKRGVLSGNYDAYYIGHFVSTDVTNYNK